MSLFKKRKTLEPPDELDGAEVLFWAFNSKKPFFIMECSDGTPHKPIHGFAICRYKGEKQYYKFSCDIDWNVENDSDHDSVEDAIGAAIDISTEPIRWKNK